MSSRVYSSLLQSAGRRFYFALDAAPGLVTPAPAVLTLNGLIPGAAQAVTVFRTPTPAALSMQGRSLTAPVVLTPITAALGMAGQIPARQLIRTITPALAAAVENPPVAFGPTLITIWNAQPGVAQLSLQTLTINITQGGNIGFISPGVAQVSLQTRQFSLLLLAGSVGVGALRVAGFAPTLGYELTITPDVGQAVLSGLTPDMSHPFIWVDDGPAPTASWITDAAA